MNQTTGENQNTSGDRPQRENQPQPQQPTTNQPLDEQRLMNIVQIQLAWWGTGFTVIGISVAFIGIGLASASLRAVLWEGGILLLIIGVCIIAFSRRLARKVFDWELDRLRNIPNMNTRSLTVMHGLQRLARVAAWTLFILGILDFLGVLIYVSAAVFGVWHLTLSVYNIAASSILGLVFLILSYIAANIRER